MANRYQDDRSRRDRFQNSYGRQEEQFDSYRGFGDERYGQMGDSWRDYDDPDTNWRYERERGFGSEDRFGTGSRGSSRDRETFRDRNYSRGRPDTYRSLSEATATGAGSQLAANHGEWREPSREYSDYRDTWGRFGAGGDTRGGGRDRSEERGFLERAGDTLAHWLGDDADYRRGERGYRGRGPANYTRSDERIREDACDRLTEDWRVDASQIEIRVENGELTLDGTVSSREQKRRAEDCVDDLSGVRHVQNNLRVQERSSWDRDSEFTGSQSNPTSTQA